MNYFIQIFGCQMNISDAQRIAGLFDSQGMSAAAKPEEVDFFVAIMCSVRQMAADRVFGLEQRIKLIKKNNPKAVTILTGCVIESDKKRFEGIFDRILNIKTLGNWPIILDLGPNLAENDYFRILPRHDQDFSSLIPISKGCDNFCSYCVVPYTRGPLVSRPANDILAEVQRAVAGGAKEIWLLGQNVNNYHFGKINFAKLLRAVDSIPGEFWIRFTSPHPKDFNEEAVLAFAQCEKATPYLNLPIQSGDDAILKAMNRPYAVKTYTDLIKKLRAAFKNYRKGLEREIAISTDVIVGFCGETKLQFNNTAKIFREIRYDMAYIAEYSQRPGTAAAKLFDNVPIKEKQRRKKAIDRIVKTTALANNKKYTQKTVEILVDSVKNGYALGKTRSYKTVKFPVSGYPAKPGDIVNVKITKVMAFGLLGKICDEK